MRGHEPGRNPAVRINLKTAQALGLEVPPSLLARPWRMKTGVSYCAISAFERTYLDWQASHGPSFSL
jgi:hypothetical protein